MSIIPEDLTANGNPFRQPRAFEVDGVEGALYPAVAVVSEEIAVGDLIQARADKTAVLASASENIEATGICIRVLSGGKIVWSHDAMIWLEVEGAGTSGLQRLFLGEDGKATTVAPNMATVQRLGTVIGYDATTEKHRCRISPEPVQSLL